MSAHPAFLKAYKNLVEKPGNAEHSAKFDRCVSEVQAKGNGKNAYAVCTAAMGDESFKAMGDNDPNFGKELELFMQKLGISGAGPVPESLLARQDLEPTASARKSSAMLRKSEEVTVIVEGSDSDGMSKAGDKCYVIRVNGMEQGRFTSRADADECLNYLTHQGTFAVLIEETVVEGAEKTNEGADEEYESEQAPATKGAVERTGKELDSAVRQAAKAEDEDEKDDLVTNIKNIQLRRQKATIASREASAKNGTFKSVWAGLNKTDD